METNLSDGRRRVLLGMLATGVFAVPGVAVVGCSSVVGRRPERLPPDRSVLRAEGGFSVNGSAGNDATLVRPGDEVETGPDGGLVFVVGETALFARPSTRLRLVPDAGGTRLERVALEAGAVLTVFPERVHRIETPLAVVGIRGTGVYAAVETGRDYICTCYGTVYIGARSDPASSETIESVRHDAPRYVLASGASGTRLRAAPFRDHSDAELLMLESLVGREPPYAVREDAYGMPRRRAY
ncbi:MAG: hypothetical protein V2J24_14315 [Pseudomonadales bacterium]|jgi:hypothetical protein|nr:hypothetical protein [Pseudomonadales bacterium]